MRRNHLARLVGFFLILLAAFGAAAQTTNGLSDAEIQGRKLAQQLCDVRPAENFTNTGVLQIRDAKGARSEIPIRFETAVTATNWQSIYETLKGTNTSWTVYRLTVTHVGISNEYSVSFLDISHYINWGVFSSSTQVVTLPAIVTVPEPLRKSPGAEMMTQFAHSDFWFCDLGLEFFHWPQQKVLKKEFHHQCACMVLESTNPNPATNGYSRVVSWIDEESGGIVQAQAYDFKNKLLKEFAPKSFKKVNGQWELQEMEIYNDQTRSRTQIKFDLKKQ